MQRAFILLWTATAIVVIALMVLLYVSLIPHFVDIGDWFVWVLRLAMICGAALMLVGTYSLIGILLSRRRREHRYAEVIAVGEIVAVRNLDGTYTHLSAQHVAAGVPRMLPAPVEEKLEATDETIVEMWADGQMTLERIAEQLKTSYYRVQRVTSEAKKRGVVRK